MALTSEEKADIIEESLPEIVEYFKAKTPYYENEDIRNKKLFNVYAVGHLRDNYTHKKNQYADGSTDLGFPPLYASIARWTDHGTYRQSKDKFWLENAFAEAPKKKWIDQQGRKAIETIRRKSGL